MDAFSEEGGRGGGVKEQPCWSSHTESQERVHEARCSAYEGMQQYVGSPIPRA